MKKSLLLFFVSSALFSANVLAQPTLTAAGINFVVGNAFTAITSTVQTNPGSSGANQTWNLSSITGQTSTYTIVTASSTSHAASFPSATMASSGTTAGTAYYKPTSTAWQYYGGYNSSAQ